MEAEDIKRKIRIRRQAYANMTGQAEGHIALQLSKEEMQRMLKGLSEECRQMDEYACLKIYGEIQARNKLVWMIKRVLRKVCHKCMGWYYVPVIEGQIDFNRQVKQALEGFGRLLLAQYEEIHDLEDQVMKLQE